MSRPLLERLALDLKQAARIADCRRDLAEAQAERADIDQRIADCERRSEDPATPDDEAQLAHRQAADWRFHAKRLDHAIAAVRDGIAAKEAAATSLERREQFAATKAARDALVERWRAFQAAWELLPSLLADTQASDRLLARANDRRPEGENRLLSAEIVARGALNESNWPNSIGKNGDPFTRLTSLNLPFFDRPGEMWPRRGDNAFSATISQLDHTLATAEAARDPKVIAAAKAREQAMWGRYTVTQERYAGAMARGVRHKGGVSGVDMEPVILWMSASQVAAARARRLKVVPAPLKAPLEEAEPLADPSRGMSALDRADLDEAHAAVKHVLLESAQ